MRFAPIVFTITYSVAYVAFLAANVTLFYYYPQVGDVGWGWQPRQGAGPAMAWYGFMTLAFPLAALVAIVVPDRVLGRIGRKWGWVVPIASMFGCVYLMSHFFTN